MAGIFLRFLTALLFLAASAAAAFSVAPESEGGGELVRIQVRDAISPVIAEFVTRSLATAQLRGASMFVLELDTPGGLDSAMRSIIQAFLDSPIPVALHVAPSGARAASAGALIALSADFIVMAPGTTIGAARPVAIGMGGGDQNEVMMEKVLSDASAYARSLAEQRGRDPQWAEEIVRESRASSAREALELGIADALAPNVIGLVEALDGSSYLRDGQRRQLHLAQARIETLEMDWKTEILAAISNPNVAYLLMMLGILGIFFEISQPGVILPGVLGTLALLLAFFGFQTLPVNYVGFLLIVLALVLFILEVKVVSFGMLTVAGVISMLFGSLMLVDSPEPLMRISRALIGVTVGVMTLLSLFVLTMVARIQRRRAVSGFEGMLGERGRIISTGEGGLRVFVHGESWRAAGDGALEVGQQVEITAIEPDGRLRVSALEQKVPEANQGERGGTC